MKNNKVRSVQAALLANFFGSGVGVHFPTRPKENWQGRGKQKKPKVR